MERIIVIKNIIFQYRYSAGFRYCEVAPSVIAIRTYFRSPCVIDCNYVTVYILLKKEIIKGSYGVRSCAVFEGDRCACFIVNEYEEMLNSNFSLILFYHIFPDLSISKGQFKTAPWVLNLGIVKHRNILMFVCCLCS